MLQRLHGGSGFSRAKRPRRCAVSKRAAPILGLLAVLGGVAHAAAPARLVSLNLCIDQVLMAIAPRDQIVALSHFSTDPQRSTNAALARTFAVTSESAEEAVLLHPDFVLASRHSALATRQALGRLGIRVKTYGVPDSIDASLDQVLEIAQDIGHPAEGAALVARIRREIARAGERTSNAPALTAAIYESSGLTAGPTTLPGELMRAVGLRNVAADRFGIDGWSPLPLESLVSNPPQILLVGEATDAATSRAQRLLVHPAIERLDRQMVRSPFPARLLYCGGPVILDSLRALEQARIAYESLTIARAR